MRPALVSYGRVFAVEVIAGAGPDLVRRLALLLENIGQPLVDLHETIAFRSQLYSPLCFSSYGI